MSICWEWDGRHASASASDTFTSHELLQSVILAFKDMHFSYNLAPKYKLVISSGAQPKKQPFWGIWAAHGWSCPSWPQLFCLRYKPFLGSHGGVPYGFVHYQTYDLTRDQKGLHICSVPWHCLLKSQTMLPGTLIWLANPLWRIPCLCSLPLTCVHIWSSLFLARLYTQCALFVLSVPSISDLSALAYIA